MRKLPKDFGTTMKRRGEEKGTKSGSDVLFKQVSARKTGHSKNSAAQLTRKENREAILMGDGQPIVIPPWQSKG